MWLRQAAQSYMQYTTYNSLPRRAAVTRHSLCHGQQQPGLAQRVGCQKQTAPSLASNPIRWAVTS